MYQKRNRELVIISLYLDNYAKQLYLREISKLANIPLKTTQNLLSNFEKSGILKSAVRGKNKYFWPNLEDVRTKFYLLHSELYKTLLFLSKYPIFKTFLKAVRTYKPLIVFGRFAKFTAIKDSDLDLLIISNKKLKLASHLLPCKIHEITLSKNNFLKSLEKKESLIKEIEEHHVILNNHSFYINAIWDHYGK